MKVASVCWCAVFMASCAWSQQAAPDNLDETLKRLGDSAKELQHSLPSFTCEETGLSEWHFRGRTGDHDIFTATLRAKRTSEGTLSESYQLTHLNGRPFSSGEFTFPYYVSGGFERAMRYFLPEQQVCYRYSLSNNRLTFEPAPDVATHAECVNSGLQGMALLDENGDILHLERRVPQQAAKQFNLAPFASIDFAPVVLNGKTFRLSSHMSSEMIQGEFVMHFEATYSDCRLFTATVKIVPANEVDPARQ